MHRPDTRPARRRHRRALFALAAALAGMLLLLLYLGLPRALVWLAQHGWGPVAQARSLAGYRADIQGRAIEGLARNTSGLSYSTASGTLFAVINRPPALAELSTDGVLLRSLPLPGLQDPEGITHVGGDLFLVSVESEHRLHWIRIGPETGTVRMEQASALDLGFSSWHNLGLEGISWDEARQTLLLVNEKFPKRVIKVRGLGLPGDQPAPGPSIRSWRPRGMAAFLGADLASVTTRGPAGNLLLLSQASGLVTEYSPAGRLLGVLPLWAGLHGLDQAVPQAEGMATGPDGTIYIVSEPNLFYRFRSPGPGLETPQPDRDN